MKSSYNESQWVYIIIEVLNDTTKIIKYKSEALLPSMLVSFLFILLMD